jgi:hypothetical protein
MSSLAKSFREAGLIYSPFVKDPDASHDVIIEDLKREVGNENSSKFFINFKYVD